MGVKIGVVIGSARDGSFNRKLAHLAAADLTKHGAEVTVIDLADYDLPMYSDALENTAFPERAKALQRELRVQDALLFATPEYNGSISGLLKNAIDWASRSIDGDPPLVLKAFRGKPAAIVSASMGPFGGLRAQAHLRQILSTVQMLVIAENVSIPTAHAAYNSDDTLIEPLPVMLLDGLAKSLVRVTTALKNTE